MAKKPAGRAKRSVAASSSKAKTSVKGSGKAKSSKRIAYKQEYIKLLQKTNKTLTKEVKAIRKAIEQPRYSADYEAFPKEPTKSIAIPVKSPRTPQTGTVEDHILNILQDIEIQIRQRDMIFEELVSGSSKLGGFDA
jgi:hypothetical protein